MEILEELKQFKCGNEDFERGFAAAINIITALNKKDDERIKILEHRIKKLEGAMLISGSIHSLF